MAEATTPAPDLKYLGYFRVAFIRTFAYLTTLYDTAKESSGVLKPGLDRVEGLVKTVVGPVYTKFEDKPDQFLVYFDGQVGAILTLLDKNTPEYVKAKTVEVVDAAKSAPQTLEKTGESLLEIGKYYLYLVWKYFLALPLTPQFVKLIMPTAVVVGNTYNSFADNLKSNDIPVVKTVAYYLPLVPVHAIAKTVKTDVDAALKVKKSE